MVVLIRIEVVVFSYGSKIIINNSALTIVKLSNHQINVFRLPCVCVDIFPTLRIGMIFSLSDINNFQMLKNDIFTIWFVTIYLFVYCILLQSGYTFDYAACML